MKAILILSSALILFSCSDTKLYDAVIGEWECRSWVNKSTRAEKCVDNVYFQFNADRTYKSVIASTSDSGTYKISNSILYVSPIGKREVVVQIIKANSEELEFLMNQGGSEEILKLIHP